VLEAAHRALRAFEPALLVLDDLQWADELSLALCHYLLRAAAEDERRLIVLAAARPSAAAAEFEADLHTEIRRPRLGARGARAGARPLVSAR
jgi:eukaryotic-like serine/threonine-protein kinase